MAIALTPKDAKLSDTPMNTPVSSMNMTPLIDVLLVLLVMFIITIPVASHSLEVNVGGDDIITPFEPDRLINKVVVSQDDTILWNGDTITRPQLVGLLTASSKMVPEPELQFEPAAQASYQASAEVMQMIKFSGVTKFGFVGNEKYREFD